MTDDYERLLGRGLAKIKDSNPSGRFEMPVPDVETHGQRTIVRNFSQIADKFRRDTQHLLKFFQKELATSGTIENGQAVFLGNITSSLITRKLADYANEFVFCKECGQPDTKMVQEGKSEILSCWACGAKRQIRNLK
ncbi:MAG: translation initiation factor IF-2 subunit beta [Candidatus Aenigmarchaeota archaeon]|nr:translation initiation factor IF-2 subunit beta [Candidatus Aenigmarchaeota archaeon]